MDSLRVHVKGGAGGFGFPKYGGEGGKGGDVCFIATEGIISFIKFHENINNYFLHNFN